MISNYQLFEGPIRGVATSPKRAFNELIRNISDEIQIHKKPKEKIEHVEKILHRAKINFQDMNVDMKDKNHKILSKLDKISRWRYFIILNDKQYNKAIEDIIKDRKGPTSWISVDFSSRHIPELYDIKSREDIVKIIDKYLDRTRNIGKLIKKHPDKWGEFDKMLNWSLHGLRDLINVIHAVVSYGSKGF